jgi:hypothetical protein
VLLLVSSRIRVCAVQRVIRPEPRPVPNMGNAPLNTLPGTSNDRVVSVAHPIMPRRQPAGARPSSHEHDCWYLGIPLGWAVVHLVSAPGSSAQGIVLRKLEGEWVVRLSDESIRRCPSSALIEGLEYESAWFYDPDAWFYDWSTLAPYRFDKWCLVLLAYLERFDLSVPEFFFPNIHAAIMKEGGAVGHLATLRADVLTSIEGSKASWNKIRNPILKTIWWFAGHGLDFPPTHDHFALYLQDLANIRSNASAPSEAVTALNHFLAFNARDVSPARRLAVEESVISATKRKYKSTFVQPEAVRGWMIGDFLRVYVLQAPRPAGSRKAAWAVVLGAAFGLCYKAFFRWDCLRRCRFDDGWCTVCESHIRFFLDESKSMRYSGAFITVASPLTGYGVYHALREAKAIVKVGFVLPQIRNRFSSPVIDATTPMPRADFVDFFRAALGAIGVTPEMAKRFTAKSFRIGAASAAVEGHLTTNEISFLSRTVSTDWVLWYDNKHLDRQLALSRKSGY